MKAYKGFDKDLKCRGHQYEIGKTYEEESADICNTGYHACERPLDVFTYYPPATSRYCDVELDANEQKSDDSKRAGKRIKIGAEIGITGIVKAQIEYVKEQITREQTAGDSGAATAGNYGAATAGDSGAATSRGKSAVGENGVAVARGNGVVVKGGLGAVLVIAEENSDNFDLKECKLVVVDGHKIKSDVWYRLENGEFKEAQGKDE